MRPVLGAAVIALGHLLAGSVVADEIHRLRCQGSSVQGRVVIEGKRTLHVYNALGDGYVRFVGRVSTKRLRGRLRYEGYTNLVPFEGVITGPFAPIPVAVLDNTGGRMIIYDGRPSLGPPSILAQLVCKWRR
jgi:hypothetical protein